MKRLLTLLSLVILQIGCTNQPLTLTSKISDMTISLDDSNGLLTINLSDKDSIISRSPISLLIDGSLAIWEVVGCKELSCNGEMDMQYGEFSKIAAPYSDMICDIKLSTQDKSIDSRLTIRLYKDAMAYRLEFTDVAKGTTLKEISQWIPSDLEGGCFAPNGEFEPIGAISISEANKKHYTPFIYKSSDRFFALHECDLFDYPQLFIQGDSSGKSLNINVEEVTVEGDITLPWRVVMVGKDLKDIHNQKPIYQTMSREPQGDFSWVKPGLSMWDWRVKGTTFDGYTYKMNTKSLKRYIDFCSSSNISYFLIDAEWCEKHNPLQPVEELDIREVVAYGNKMGVGIILYYDQQYVDENHPPIDFETIAAAYQDFGVAGIKYGFLKADDYKSKTTLTQDLIKIAAKHKMVIDFHDSPIPFSGLERTFPNYINREYCHAQLDRRTAFTPTQFVKMASVNLLAGHMDQTNGTYALNEMKSRSKGPLNDYPSTVSAETARFLFTHTGSLAVLIDAPEAYKQKGDLFTLISSMPKSWDETIYLEMEFDSHVAVAKRTGERWFTSVVYGDSGGKNTLDLEFLESGATYSATIYRDAEDTDYQTNKEAYTIETVEVSADDKISVDVPSGGGYSVIFNKK